MSRKSSSLVRCTVAALVAASTAAVAAPAPSTPSTQFPTYTVGQLPNGSYVMSSNQIITPAGTVVQLAGSPGSPSTYSVRVKAVALDPVNPEFASVLLMGASSAVDVIDVVKGSIVQQYKPFSSSTGSFTGIAYTPDGKHLLVSQDSSYLAVANVDAVARTLTDNTHVKLPASNAAINCSGITLGLPADPVTGLCGEFYTGGTSNPAGVAVSADSKTAYVLLNQNNTLQAVDLSNAATNGQVLVSGNPVTVGNAPNSVVLNGRYAYVSNEGGRAAVSGDFTGSSSGTPIVATKSHGASATGTISVYDTVTGKIVATIDNTGGLHPTGMAISGGLLYVTNTSSENIGVIDLATNKLVRTISVALPLPGEDVHGDHDDHAGDNDHDRGSRAHHAFGAQPTSIAVVGSTAYVTLYTANAIAVVDLNGHEEHAVQGYIPTASTPGNIAYDATHNQLVVTNDKGLGAKAYVTTSHGSPATDREYNSHGDQGTVSLIAVPSGKALQALTAQVYQNNHWDLAANIDAATGGNPWARPVAIPRHIGDPSLIKHVFVIVRENRTYDQVLGDVKAGNGDADLAVFAPYTPNAHTLVTRFPLLDNYYNPSRQSADGHNWLVQGFAPYEDEVQSPDWIRSYPANAQDVMAYQPKGFVWDAAIKKGLNVKIYGEYVEYAGVSYNNPDGTTNEPSWTQFYTDALSYEGGSESQLKYLTAVNTISEIPSVQTHHVQHFPVFDLGIPDQFRVDLWQQDFNTDVKAGDVPALETLWIMCDHTGGPPGVAAEQADNDLAVGRIVDAITHSAVWKDSVIFVTEDDAQDGVDHVDGHRSPGYVISPYSLQAAQGASPVVNSTFYTQTNVTRTIEQILGLAPMNQFDLVASPMYDLFTDAPPAANFAPWTHVANTVPLCTTGASETAPYYTGVLSGFTVNGVNCTASTTTARNLRKAGKMEKEWAVAMNQVFKGKQHMPDAENPDVVSHWNWYEATGYARPFPGESKIRSPKSFGEDLLTADADGDGDGK